MAVKVGLALLAQITESLLELFSLGSQPLSLSGLYQDCNRLHMFVRRQQQNMQLVSEAFYAGL